MKWSSLLVAACWPVVGAAQIQLVADAEPQAVFAGATQDIHVILRNVGDQPTAKSVEWKLFQLSAASAVRIGDVRPWKRIDLLPRQTVLENVPVTLPEVRAATRFGIDLAGIGRVEVTAHPRDLLKRLNGLAGDVPLGVFDPDEHVKPALKQAGVLFGDFEIEPTDCKLAVVWSNARSLPESVKTRVTRGMSVVRIRSSTVPAAYAVRVGAGVVVIAPESTMHDLADSPLPQLTLIRDAELALQPDALRLPVDDHAE